MFGREVFKHLSAWKADFVTSLERRKIPNELSATVSGISIDGSTQTTGIGSKVSDDSFASGFIGWNGGEVSSGSPVDSIAGATYSSNGAFNAINAAIDCYNNEIKGVQ